MLWAWHSSPAGTLTLPLPQVFLFLVLTESLWHSCFFFHAVMQTHILTRARTDTRSSRGFNRSIMFCFVDLFHIQEKRQVSTNFSCGVLSHTDCDIPLHITQYRKRMWYTQKIEILNKDDMRLGMICFMNTLYLFLYSYHIVFGIIMQDILSLSQWCNAIIYDAADLWELFYVSLCHAFGK